MKPHLPFTIRIAPYVVFAAAPLLGIFAAPHATAEAARPNVILVLSDDQGYGDFSCLGNPILKTPNLDRLHAQSVRLTDFHVAPMCSPTRGQLMTGLDALHNGSTFVCMGRSMIRPGLPTMAELFEDAGYKTAHFGKWHLGDNYPYRPQDRGFQETIHHPSWGITSLADYFGNDYFHDHFRHNGEIEEFRGYCTDVWFGEAMKWIRARAAVKEPFFVYLPTNAPHEPHWVPESYRRPYVGKVGPEVASFFGTIANLDENVGKLMAMLDETGLATNTILIYMTDNGGTAGVKVFNAGMRGQKQSLYEGGHRVPCFIRWPAGYFGRPRDEDNLTECQDILPTLVDWCKLKPPRHAAFDGDNLGWSKLPNASRMLVVQYGGVPKRGDAAVMWNKWRLIKGKELYDLGTDPGQRKDIAADHPEIVQKMQEHYDKWWTAQMPAALDYCDIPIGTLLENPVRLAACDWAGVYCDNPECDRAGANLNGAWHVRVDRAGTYSISLHRWPVESGLAIRAGAPALVGPYGGLPPGKALPIAKARLQIGQHNAEQLVGPNDQQATFTVELKPGATTLQTWFLDTNDKPLCGAYYVIVERK